jgi:hypothetical protein
MDPNQGGPPEGREWAGGHPSSAPLDVERLDPVPAPTTPGPLAAVDDEALRRAAEERRLEADRLGGKVHGGLLRWVLLALVGSVSAVLLGRSDAALFLAMATLFALTQSWDVRDRARMGELRDEPSLEPGGVGTALRVLVPLVIPVASAICYVAMGLFAGSLPATAAHVGAMRWSWAAAAACLSLTIPDVSRLVARAFFARSAPSYTARLTASIALALLLLPVPMRLLIDELLTFAGGPGRPLVDVGSLVGQLVGEVVMALGAVGLWVARDARAVRERLGLYGVNMRQALIGAAGLAAVMLVNGGMEALEHVRFPALWAADQAMGKMIAGSLSPAASVVLGVSAGVGEELLVRGALQPRAGLLWASLLFATAHVQYTWFGMVTIAMLGITLGLVRNRANTTTAILVHAVYDIIAALGAK